MPGIDRHNTTLKDDFSRQLRSSSPAVKRPASEMDAQDREEYIQDVDMERSSSPAFGNEGDRITKAKQQDTGQRHHQPVAIVSPSQSSDSTSVSQDRSSHESTVSTLTSLLQNTNTSTAPSVDLEKTYPESFGPSIDEQVRIVTQMIEKPVQDKQKGYVVSTKWLNRVLSRSSHKPDGLKVDKSSTEGEIGPVDNSDLFLITEDRGKFTDERGNPFIQLRPGLTKGEELRVLPEEAWNLVIQWYQNGRDSPIITRYAHKTNVADEESCEYELYPPIFSLLKVTANSTTQGDIPPVRMLASRETLIMNWLKNAKKLLNIEMSTKVRTWKILGGLKSTSASGIITPAASRSASPAPGADIVASAGDLMILDPNTFAALHIGDQRELVELKDQTANENYDGRSLTLGLAGLGRDDVIVLEEETSTGYWPSEASRLHLTTGKASLGKSKSVIGGRSSPAPGPLTRGRQKRDGRPKGISGLSNLGNTCYMNSALQCIRSVEELTQYFLLDQYKVDLNPSNPLGHHGHVAKAYADLLKNIYDDGPASFSPSKFKNVIGRYGSSFSGYQQQDSQEFLLFLLDGLQEDLNRIHKKPYIEKPDSTDEMVHNHAALKAFADQNWDDYKKRNDSVITDLFAGMYKSTVTCPVCDKVSIIFDPFSNLTLQLPVENTWSREIVYFPLHSRPIRVEVDIDKHSNIKVLKEFIAKRVKADPDKLVMAESYRSRFYTMFDNTAVISESNIQNNDILCVYELDSIPTNYNPNKTKKYSSSIFASRDSDNKLVDANSPEADRLLVPVFHRLIRDPNVRSPSRPFFGEASYIVIDREDAKSYDRILKKVLGNVAGMTTLDIFNESQPMITTPEGSDTAIMTDDGQSSDSNNIQAVSVQGDDEIVDVIMNDGGHSNDHQTSESTLPDILRPGTFIPAALQNMFEMKAVSTGEGIPTGWNQIDENHAYESIASRIPRIVTHRPRPIRPQSLSIGQSGSSSSDEDAEEIPHDPKVNHEDSGIDSDDEDMPSLEVIAASHRLLNSSKLNKNKSGNTVHKSEALIRPGEAIILDWAPGPYDRLFADSEGDDNILTGTPTWKEAELFKDQELAAKRAQRQARRKNGITLEDCLNEFGKSETLSENNAWFCPRCKEHRRADKMFELWKAPDILVMHLKRFSSNRNFRDKLEVFVDYPVEGLDMTSRVIEKEEGKGLIYDLIAVDNHYGGLGGGHYTAFAKNFYSKGWYEYNDSHVSSRSNPQAVVTNAAYLLFYRRRSNDFFGSSTLKEVLHKENQVGTDSDVLSGSREPSPSAGEGRRLGDSSHNGLSSAFAAGQAHRVGDGGSAILRNQKQDLGVIRGGASPLKSFEMISSNDDDQPPTYTAGISEGEQHIDDETGLNFSSAPQISISQTWNERSSPWPEMSSGNSVLSKMVVGTPGSVYSDPEGERAASETSSTKGDGGSPDSYKARMRDLSDDHDDPMEMGGNLDLRAARESAPPPGADEDDDYLVQQLPDPTHDTD